MITDEQGRKWMFKKLYDAGWRYCVANTYGNVYLTDEKPTMDEDVDEFMMRSCNEYIGADGFKSALPKLKANEVLSIAEELGVIDWFKVPVDTPVIVWDKRPEISQRRYFAKFKHGQIFTWNDGATSWSAFSKDACTSWLNGKLVEL